MLSKLAGEDGLPITAFERGLFFRQCLQVFAGKFVVILAFGEIFESVVDTTHHELQSKSSVDGPIFSFRHSNCSLSILDLLK